MDVGPNESFRSFLSFSLLPKLRSGTFLSKLCFECLAAKPAPNVALAPNEAELLPVAIPSRAWDRGRRDSLLPFKPVFP